MTALMVAVQRQLPEIVHIMITDHNVKVDLTNQVSENRRKSEVICHSIVH